MNVKRPIRVTAFVNSSGSAYWRIKDPFTVLNATGEFDCRVCNEGISREVLDQSDVVITQMTTDKAGIALIHEYQCEHGLKYVLEQDDYFTVTDDNPFKLHHQVTNAEDVIKIAMGIADMVTCTTPYLASKLDEYSKNVAVLPNYMLMRRWDVPKAKKDPSKVKILWAGSITHIKDMGEISEPLKRIANEFKNTEFYFIGDIRMSDIFGSIPRSEFMLGTDFLSWPEKLAGLGADIGIAPLQDLEFTRCKSNIKPMEYGVNAMPSVASCVEPYGVYNGVGGVYLAKGRNEWYTHLKALVSDKGRIENEGKSIYKYIRDNFDLEKNIYKWADAYRGIL